MERDAITSIVYGAIAEVSNYAGEILAENRNLEDQEVCLVDLGINSIDYAEIAMIVMDNLKISHSLDIFTRTNKLREVVDIFYELQE